MSEAPFTFDKGSIELVLDPTVYRLSAVKKAAYRLADRFIVVFGSLEDSTKIPVTLVFQPNIKEAAALESARAFHKELLDQELRESLAEEIGPMRALILAHAFSKTDLIRRE